MTTFPVVNPTTGQVVADVTCFGAATTDRVVGEAVAAAREWGTWAPTRRGDALAVWADVLERHAAELAALDADAMGRTVHDTVAEVPVVADRCRSWAGLCDKVNGEHLPLVGGRLTYVRRAPLGVIAVLLPWWGPVANLVDHCAAALTFGNAVVVKPSVHAPLSALRLGELAVEAGLPPGLISLAPGDDVTGRLLAAHPQVAAVRVAGRVDSVREVTMAVAARVGLVRPAQVAARPGGRCVQVVFADADLDAAAGAAMAGVFTDAGRAIRPATRVLVERPAVNAMTDRLTAALDAVVVGDPHAPQTQLGPLPSQRHVQRVQAYLDDIAGSGASVHASAPADGCFIGPAVINAAPLAGFADGEVDGPVLAVVPFDTEAEAVALANDVAYSQAASVWTADLARSWRVPESLAADAVWVNGRPGEELATAGQAELEELTRPHQISFHYGR